MVLKALFMVPAVSDLSFVNGWQPGPVLSPGLRPAVRRPVVRTAFSAFNGPFRFASLCPGYLGTGILPRRNQDKI